VEFGNQFLKIETYPLSFESVNFSNKYE